MALRNEEMTSQIIGAAIEVHRALGPGLLESAYEHCLARELRDRGMTCERQVQLPVVYKGERVEAGYRIDIIVESTVVVELKCVEAVLPVHRAQLLTYLKLSEKPVGLLINFLVPVLKDGVVRLVL